MNPRNKALLDSLRLTQEEYVDKCGWDAARYRWHLQGDCRPRPLCQIAADMGMVLWARIGAIVATGVSAHLVVRECYRAIPAIASLALLFMRPNRVQPGHLRKVFRYTYCGWDKRRTPQPAAL